MKRYLIMSVMFILMTIAAYISPTTLIALDAPAPAAKPTIEDNILTYATQFGSNPDTIYSVMMCESQGKWIGGDFRDGVYHSFGQFQYFQGTWDRYAQLYRKIKGVDDQFDIHSEHDQVKLTSWVFSLDESAKSEWTTYVALHNGGTYTFYSKFHKKKFTVKCPLQKLSTKNPA